MDQSLLNYRIDKHFIDFCQEKNSGLSLTICQQGQNVSVDLDIVMVNTNLRYDIDNFIYFLHDNLKYRSKVKIGGNHRFT